MKLCQGALLRVLNPLAPGTHISPLARSSCCCFFHYWKLKNKQSKCFLFSACRIRSLIFIRILLTSSTSRFFPETHSHHILAAEVLSQLWSIRPWPLVKQWRPAWKSCHVPKECTADYSNPKSSGGTAVRVEQWNKDEKTWVLILNDTM